jgi:hypothetical protein
VAVILSDNLCRTDRDGFVFDRLLSDEFSGHGDGLVLDEYNRGHLLGSVVRLAALRQIRSH